MSQSTRYDRQRILPQVGDEGQQRLRAARVLVVGCGALGSVIAEQLVRAGVGFVRLVDRDLVEWTNLQRQVLFDEADAQASAPKALAAANRLAKINSDVTIEPVVVDVDSANIPSLIDTPVGRVDLILDATDNAGTRYLVNDLAVREGVPWVYGAVIGTEGRVMPILPGEACLRCIFPTPPAAGELATCEQAGVLASAVAVVASLQVTAGMQILLGADVPRVMHALDVWTGRFRTISVAQARQEDCPCCGRRQFEFLAAPPASGVASLCGRDAVQVRPQKPTRLDLEALANRLEGKVTLERQRFFVRIRLDEGQMLSVFPDGRVIVSGTRDTARARSLVAQWVGV